MSKQEALYIALLISFVILDIDHNFSVTFLFISPQVEYYVFIELQLSVEVVANNEVLKDFLGAISTKKHLLQHFIACLLNSDHFSVCHRLLLELTLDLMTNRLIILGGQQKLIIFI